MKTAIESLQTRATDAWLVNLDSQKFFELAIETWQELTVESRSYVPFTVLLADREPLSFLAHFIAACAANCHIFLANPDWATAEWQQVFEQIQPDIVWPENSPTIQHSKLKTQNSKLKIFPSPLIMIPTGGTSGRVRFVMHSWETLMTSVQGFRSCFDCEHVNSCCVLPLYHVSGLMQFLRSFTSGGRLAVLPFKALEAGASLQFDPAEYFLSLVPTQLQRLLQQPQQPDRLAQFQTVLLGGAPAWSELLVQARQMGIRLAPTYGMTETASQIATLKPEDFLAGRSGCGQVLPHAEITIRSATGESVPAGQAGAIVIRSAALALGYYPTRFEQTEFLPDDLGWLDAAGFLHISGRQSDKIITGGENVFPAEVEAAIRATGLVQDVCVVGVPDRYWGQAVVALYVPIAPELPVAQLQAAIANTLSKFKRPKHWLAMDQLPRNAQGKLDRSQINRLIESRLRPATEPPNLAVG
jgi:O-succinylbenzoic acid--CoA ligase